MDDSPGRGVLYKMFGCRVAEAAGGKRPSGKPDMIFVEIVRRLAREVGRGRWSSYVLRSKVQQICSTDAALRVERAGKATPAGNGKGRAMLEDALSLPTRNRVRSTWVCVCVYITLQRWVVVVARSRSGSGTQRQPQA